MKRKIAILTAILTSASLTGFGPVDDLAWKFILAGVAAIAFAIVGALYALHLISGRRSGSRVNKAVTALLLLTVINLVN